MAAGSSGSGSWERYHSTENADERPGPNTDAVDRRRRRVEPEYRPDPDRPDRPDRPDHAHACDGGLRRTHGATVAELCVLTGWLPHSTRASLSGLRKQGTVLVKSKRKSGVTAYRIAAAADA